MQWHHTHKGTTPRNFRLWQNPHRGREKLRLWKRRHCSSHWSRSSLSGYTVVPDSAVPPPSHVHAVIWKRQRRLSGIFLSVVFLGGDLPSLRCLAVHLPKRWTGSVTAATEGGCTLWQQPWKGDTFHVSSLEILRQKKKKIFFLYAGLREILSTTSFPTSCLVHILKNHLSRSFPPAKLFRPRWSVLSCVRIPARCSTLPVLMCHLTHALRKETTSGSPVCSAYRCFCDGLTAAPHPITAIVSVMMGACCHCR